MFNKFRNGGKSGSKSSSKLGPGASSDSRAGRGEAQGPRIEPPHLELPRHRAAQPAAYPQGGAPSAPRAASDKPAHLKPVGAKIDQNAWHPKLATPKASTPQAPARPAARPVAQPISQPVAQTPTGGPVPARPPIPPYPVSGPAAGARAAAAPQGAQKVSAPTVAAPAPATPLATNSTGAEVQSLGRLMLVGPQIRLTGEIKACERLVVEGTVEGEVSETERLEVARGGAFHGTARVESCMIDGLFEGELDVQGVLTLRPNGRVQGTVHYGDIEIERGGRIAGTFGPRGNESERDGTRPVRSNGPRQA
jgi:cytoskeletal protein CcmA (bactofilin family)